MVMVYTYLPIESITLASGEERIAGESGGCRETMERAASHPPSRPGLVVAWTSTLGWN